MYARIAVFALALSAACGGGENAPVRAPQGASDSAGRRAAAELTEAAEAFYRDDLAFSPTWAVTLGYHEYDGVLPDRSPEAIAAEVERLRAALETFRGIDPAALPPLRQVEREVLITRIRGQLFDLETTRAPLSDPMYYPSALDLTYYISRDYAPLPERARAIIGICDGAGDYLAQARENLPEVMPKTWVETALLQVNGMIEFVGGDVAEAMKGLDDSALAGELESSLGRCKTALAGYRDFLEARKKTAGSEFALGTKRFLQMLSAKEGLDVDLQRLTEVGRADLERNQEALEAAAKAIDPDKPVRAVVAVEDSNKPEPNEVLRVAEQQAVEMRRFVDERDIVSIPSDDRAEVRETPPFMRWNSAFLSSAGPFETEPLPSFYYISPPDPSWPDAKQKAYIPSIGDLLSTTIHELWPGHFLHALHKKKNRSKILASYCTYSMAEGWAHYTEEMMWEAGVGDGDPRVHIGQLGDALMRNARYLSAIGLHTGDMTVNESKTLFANVAMSDEATAAQQARRGTFDPGYLNYTLGKLMIYKLRRDWKAKVGDRYSLRAFHDEFLSYGCAPIPVIRRAMLGEDATGSPLAPR